MDDRCEDVVWMLLPMLQLEILQRREAALFDAKFNAAEGEFSPALDNNLPLPATKEDDARAALVVDLSEEDNALEDGSEPPTLLTVPVELLAKILRRCRLTGATAFGLASKRCSARLYDVLLQAADRKARAADAWKLNGARAAARLKGCRWERWRMIDGPYGAYGGHFEAIDWRGVDSETIVSTDEPVVAMQLRRCFASALIRSLSAATVHGPGPADILTLVGRWAYALRASAPACPDAPSVLPRVWYQDYGLSAAAIGRLARTWRRQHRWTSQQLASLVNVAAWGEDTAPPHARLPPAPPVCYPDDAGGVGSTTAVQVADHPYDAIAGRARACLRASSCSAARSSEWEALTHLPNACVPLQHIDVQGDVGLLRSFTLEFHLRWKIVNQIASHARRDRPPTLPSEWLRGFGGGSGDVDEQLEWLTARLLQSVRAPTSVDPPLHRDALRLRVDAEVAWRRTWLRYVAQIAASAAVGFHRILRLSCASDVPAPPRTKAPYKLSTSLSMVFGHVSLTITVYDTAAEEAESDLGRAIDAMIDAHSYPTPMRADLGPRATQVELLKAYLASPTAPPSCAGRAQFLLTLCCARRGDPASGSSFGTRGGPMRHFDDATNLAQLGQLMADLALPMADVVALIAAFGSRDGPMDHRDFVSTDPTPVFEAWAERVDFPSAWGGMDAWRHFRGLNLTVGPFSRPSPSRSAFI